MWQNPARYAIMWSVISTHRPEAELLTVEQVVALLQLARSSIYRLMDLGELRRVKVGRSARIPRSEVERFLRRLEAEQWENTSDRAS
jgi:excisionase family DNA binding protein